MPITLACSSALSPLGLTLISTKFMISSDVFFNMVLFYISGICFKMSSISFMIYWLLCSAGSIDIRYSLLDCEISWMFEYILSKSMPEEFVVLFCLSYIETSLMGSLSEYSLARHTSCLNIINYLGLNLSMSTLFRNSKLCLFIKSCCLFRMTFSIWNKLQNNWINYE